LVAELASCFVCATYGFSWQEAQSPAYLDNWLKVSRAIFSIASYASQAADWLLNRAKEENMSKVEDAIPY
jgi:antirestriction protein ArdC